MIVMSLETNFERQLKLITEDTFLGIQNINPKDLPSCVAFDLKCKCSSCNVSNTNHKLMGL